MGTRDVLDCDHWAMSSCFIMPGVGYLCLEACKKCRASDIVVDCWGMHVYVRGKRVDGNIIKF